MIRFLVLLAASMMVCGMADALPADPSEYSAWEQGMLQGIRDQESKPPDEAIPKLSLWVYQLSLPKNKEHDGRPVFTAAQNALLAIPGHAEYYAKKIKDAQYEVERQRGTDQEGPAKSKLLAGQMYGFQRLALMPSPETVRVLGDFLLDPWGLRPDAKPLEDHSNSKFGEGSHAGNALIAIARLPLETRANTTPPEMTTYWADIDAWKLWYQQVKAGTRTFRFKGDPQDYNLQGPVSKAAEPTLATRPGKNEVAEMSGPVASHEEISRLRVVALVAVCGILGVAFWLSVIRRRPAGVKGQSP